MRDARQENGRRSGRKRSKSTGRHRSRRDLTIAVPTDAPQHLGARDFEQVPVDLLRENPRNARTHPEHQLARVIAAIQQFGFWNPLIAQRDRTVVCGHARLEAARRLKMKTVPVIWLDGLKPAQVKAYAIADNRLAELAGWNFEILAQELRELELQLDFPVEITGFETVDIDLMVDRAGAEKRLPATEVVPMVDRTGPAVSSLGDQWQLGPHVLRCGNALIEADLAALMAGARAQLVIVDPPYNVAIDGHVCGLGKIRHRSFAMASGEMTKPEFLGFLRTAFGLLAAFCQDGAINFIFMDWRHQAELLAAGDAVYAELKNLIVWNKTNAGMGSFYRSKHELIYAYKVGEAKHINNFGLGDRGRYRTNVWDYPGVNTFRRGRQKELEAHPTVKPLALVADAIKDCSTRNGLVLDSFAGSGTVLLAAERTGRIARALEIDPHYVDVAIGRWETMTGGQAIHASTGLTFAETRDARSLPAATKRGGRS